MERKPLARSLVFFFSILGLYLIGYAEKTSRNPAYGHYFLKKALRCVAPDCGHLQKEKFLRNTIYYNPNLSQGYYELGVLLEQKGQKQDALKLFAIGGMLNFKDAPINARLGGYYFEIAQWELAFRHLSLSVKASSACDQCHFYLGQIFQSRGQYDQAFEAYGRVAEAYPRFPVALANMGVLSHLVGDYLRAQKIIKSLSSHYAEETLAAELANYIKTGQKPSFAP